MFTKEEIHAVLKLASKFHNEHTSLPFTAAEIPDAIHAVISDAYAELVATAKTTTHAFGFVLRSFANAHVPAVIEAIAAPVEAVVEVIKQVKVKKPVAETAPEPEPVVAEEPVAEEPAAE